MYSIRLAQATGRDKISSGGYHGRTTRLLS
jgi:hypothetical protein